MRIRLTAQRGRAPWTVYASALALAVTTVAHAEAPWPDPVASYTIEAHLDAETRTVSGSETLHWTNTTSHPADELQFHLYLNAFANSRSTFMRESQDAWTDWAENHDDPWGYIEVTSLRTGGQELIGDARFIQPDDGNVDDRTVLAVVLPEPVAPGAGLDLEIDFSSRLPRVFARSGHAGPFVFVGQWFPKLGVFEDEGRWNCHQYHRTTEFYSDFGTYDVTLHIPADHVAGATGKLEEQGVDPDGKRRLRFRAEGVHDFAWTVDPRFEVIERTISGIAVRLLIQPSHRVQAERYLDSLRAAVEYYEAWIGRYPYEHLTLVDPGPGGFAAGGMEYPTLITLGTTWWMPTGLRAPEVVTVHEFGHQYWYGIVASNEFEHAWLDEGINSYVEMQVMKDAYGDAAYFDLFGLRGGGTTDMRMGYLRAPAYDPIVRPAWQFIDRTSYASVSYAKTALALDTLAGRYGREVVRDALEAFFDEAQFTHPRPEQFLSALSTSAGEDLSWYFDQVIRGTGVLDYAVTLADSTEIEPLAGYSFKGGSPSKAPDVEDEEETPHYRNEIVVERLGSVTLPVAVSIQFDDGTSTVEQWDGKSRWKRFEYTGTQRVDWAVVDPENVLSLDTNQLNNSRMRRPGTRGIVRLSGRWGFWFQSVLQILTGM